LQRIKRGTDGGFKDADLANILHNSWGQSSLVINTFVYSTYSTEHSAGAFRARGTPCELSSSHTVQQVLMLVLSAVMRLNEIMGIEQNRKWGVCSLNDFRKVREPDRNRLSFLIVVL
jgi:hypothetical protein